MRAGPGVLPAVLIALLTLVASGWVSSAGAAGDPPQYGYDGIGEFESPAMDHPADVAPDQAVRLTTTDLAAVARWYDAVANLARASASSPLHRPAPQAIPGVKTPYGMASQADDAASLALRSQTEAGATVYRQGSFGVQETGSGQFWAGTNPLTSRGYASSYGTPGSAAPDWVMGGTVRPGAPFVTRPAPGIGPNLGGAPEVVVRPGSVFDLWFHMP